MKAPIALLICAISILSGTEIFAQGNSGKEVYAIITFQDKGKNFTLNISESHQKTQKIEIEKENRSDHMLDQMHIVIAEMDKLSDKGFELVSSPTSVIPTSSIAGEVFFAFVFKKVLE